MEGRERGCKQPLAGKMSAPNATRTLCACAGILLLVAYAAADPDPSPSIIHNEPRGKNIELFDGVSVQLPEKNNTEKLISFEIDTKRSFETGRKKSGKQKKLMERILPMFILPFLVQSTIVPFFLSMLKFMLLKSMMVGKLALALILLNAFKNHNSVKGRDAEMADVHYGYGHGMEFGTYFN